MWLDVDLPEEDTWCWVTNGRRAWIAKKHSDSAGGWTNGDTWQDFYGEVVAWWVINVPDSIYKQDECLSNLHLQFFKPRNKPKIDPLIVGGEEQEQE